MTSPTAVTVGRCALFALFGFVPSAPASPVAYWSFDTDALDASGFHNGALIDGASISTGTQGFGGSGEALSLAGGGQHMRVGSPTALDFNNDFTWHAYVKTGSSGAGILSRSQFSGDWNQGSKALFLESGRVEWDTGWVGNPNTGVTINDNTWHQVIVVYVASSDTLNIFVDPSAGATSGQYSASHNVNAYDEHSHTHNGGTADSDFRVGWVSPDFQSNGLVGLIDEVGVFDSALTGMELDQLITQGPASFWGPVAPPAPTGTIPFISELVAVGNTTRQDEDGDRPDWLEIYNPTGADIDLAGYHLTDESGNLTKWTFPSTLLLAGKYLVVYASDKNRAVAGSELHLNFKLAGGGEYLALVEPDGTTIISEFTPTFPVQVEGFSYGVGGLAPADSRGYFATPSPGSQNGTLLSAPLIAPVLSPPYATFPLNGNVVVTITPGIAFLSSEIRYTTNGSVPIKSSSLYNGTPVTISNTTHLRARVFDTSTGGGGAIAGGQYQELASSSNLSGIPAPNAFDSNLPIMVVENFGAGGIPGPGATLQTARVSVFEVDPASGRASLSETPDASFRIGIRRRGQSSSGFSKPQYRVELRDESDVDLDYPLLGLPSESDWVFNGPWTDKALIRNSLSFELGRTIGVEAPRTKHFEMFLSTNGGDLTSSEYVGVYVLFEKIKRGKNRTDIAGMSPSDNSGPEVTGGYLTRFEPPGIANDGPRATNWNTVEILEPDAPTQQQREYLGQYYDDFLATLGWSRGSGANNSGVVNPDPVTGYPAFIDVDSFVNMMIVTELGRDQDAYVRSDYMHKDRNGKLKKGPLWDHNLTMNTGCCFDNRNPVGWQYQNDYNRGGRDHNYEPDWFVPLMRDPDFNQQFIDRWTELRRNGALDMTALFDRIDTQADPLAEAAVRNFTKWDTLGQNGPGFGSPSTATWEEQIDEIKDWLTIRLAWIDSEFQTVPTLSPAGGMVAGGSSVVVSSAESVYYTLDGSDPRLPGGGIKAGALFVEAGGANIPVNLIATGSSWRFLDDGSDQGDSEIVGAPSAHPSYEATHWKHPAFVESGWGTGDAILGFGDLNGIVPDTLITKGPISGQHLTYYFRKTFNIADASQLLSLSCEILRDDGAIIYLNGKEIARSNMTAGNKNFEDLAQETVASAGELTYETITLDPADLVDGTNIVAVEVHQGSTNSNDLGFDFSLDGTRPPGGASGVTITETSALTARARTAGGEWSGATQSIYVVGTPASAANLALTELNYHPSTPTAAETLADPTYNDDDFEFIEVKNVSAAPIDLSGLSFVDGITFTVPTITVLAVGEYGVFVENLAAFRERYGAAPRVLGVYADKFSNDGEPVHLLDINGNDIFNFTFNDIWYPPTDGDGYTLVAIDEDKVSANRSEPANWAISCQLSGNPGAANGPVFTYTFDSWKNYYFDAAGQLDLLISGPGADRESDGIVTLLEFGLGLNPNLNDVGRLPYPGVVNDGGEDYLTITFRRLKKAIDLDYRVMVSDNLTGWIQATTEIGVPTDNGDGTETVTIRDSVKLVDSPRRFIQLSVEAQFPVP